MIFGEHSILTTLEDNLGKTNAYICGPTISLVDIVIYCELITVMMVTEQNFPSLNERGFHETHRWGMKLGEFPCFKEGGMELLKVIKDNSLHEKINH